MIGKALVAQVLPWALLAAVLAVPAAYVVGRDHGGDAEKDRRAKVDAEAYVSAVEHVASLGEAIAIIGRSLATALQSSVTAETQDVRTVREVIHAYPEFGAVRRPAALERVRRQQLEDVAAATEANGL
jgi:hypothetical protein